jgi:hypothetical protein
MHWTTFGAKEARKNLEQRQKIYRETSMATRDRLF